MNHRPQSPKTEHLKSEKAGSAEEVPDVGADGSFQDRVEWVEVFCHKDHWGDKFVVLWRE
jgi:hypothetical protein